MEVSTYSVLRNANNQMQKLEMRYMPRRAKDSDKYALYHLTEKSSNPARKIPEMKEFAVKSLLSCNVAFFIKLRYAMINVMMNDVVCV
jgi:hypothetical protein